MAKKEVTKTTTEKKAPAKKTTKKTPAKTAAVKVQAEAVEEVKTEEPRVEEAKVEEPKTAKAKKTTKTTKTTKATKTAKAAKTTKTTKAATAEVEREEPKKKTVRRTKKAAEEVKVEEVKTEKPKSEAIEEVKTEEPKAEVIEEVKEVEQEVMEEPKYEMYTTPRRSIAFIGSECYPFVKTGGLGDVMYALPKALVKQNCDVKVILPRYKCIPWEYQMKMEYRGAFEMDLCADGRSYYVGIMEYECDGVVYDFIDNEEFFGGGNPYTNLIDDIQKYCFFSKAALAALNYLDWIPDIIHCHDWQAALVPVYLRTMFENTKLTAAKTILTIHNLRFQGIYNIPTIRYWSGLPDYVFNKDALKVSYNDANMLKGGLTYSNVITTVSHTYAGEIQTAYYGEQLDAHLRYHSGK